MRNWRHKINLKKYLNESEDLESVKGVALNFHSAISKDSWFVNFRYIAEFKKFEFLGITSVEYFNYLMDKLYDYADANDIWID